MAHILRGLHPTPPSERKRPGIGAESAGSTPPGGLALRGAFSAVRPSSCRRPPDARAGLLPLASSSAVLRGHRAGSHSIDRLPARLIRPPSFARAREVTAGTTTVAVVDAGIYARVRPSATLVAGASLVLMLGAPLSAQRLVTRRDAVETALAGGARIALARADSAAARARALTARALPNPSVAASYSKSTPQKHLSVELPLESPWLRGARIGAANALTRAARLQLLSERTAAVVEVDTTYTRALAADARFRLSRQTARDADSLRQMTIARRDAGDASDLDVDLATVAAGQQTNVASTDSLRFMSAVLTVQTLMGLSADTVAIVLADTLRVTPPDTAVSPVFGGDASASSAVAVAIPSASIGAAAPSTARPTPSIAAAEANLSAAELAIRREHRGVLPWPALSVGVEFGDPTGAEPGYLPVVGLVLPLPLFNRNQGPIAEATAERDRARAQLAAVRLEVRQRLVEGLREREALRRRIARDIDLVTRAQRVATRSLTAYREGASALPAVLEARRSAREVLVQYIDDVADLLTVNTELRALTQTVPSAP
jgi:cobalt-zinc-cadmium efflux system outer membrane protein